MISGFISASGLIIAASQLKHILGIQASGHSLLELLQAIGASIANANPITIALGIAATVFLFWVRRGLKPLLLRIGLGERLADICAKAGPLVAIALTTAAVWLLSLSARGVATVGEIPSGLPPLTVPEWNPALWSELLGPAVLIGIVGFVESVSVGQTLAAKRRQRIDPDQELVALGTSNIAASFTGGFPVTGGFSRSAVNYDAGAQTPAAGVYTAGGLALASLFLTPALFYLPKATLAATIIVAVLSLVDLGIFRRTWRYSKADFTAVATTFVATLVYGIEVGLIAGVSVPIGLFLYRSSKPHVAIVGLVPGTEHFRNVLRHDVRCSPQLLSLRVDESLYFANARYLEDRVNEAVAAQPTIKHVVIQCSAVNDIDTSALESLETIDNRLQAAGITLHLSEVKGPVSDKLNRTNFFDHLSGETFLTHYQAVHALTPEVVGTSTSMNHGST